MNSLSNGAVEPTVRSEALSTDEFEACVLYADESYVVIDKPQVNHFNRCF